MSRRHLLGGVVTAALVVGCAPRSDASESAGGRRGPGSTSRISTANPAPTAAASSAAELPVDPRAVAARFAGRRPRAWGMDVPGVRSRHAGPGIALTLDACGGPRGDGYDGELIDGLVARDVPATLFLNKRWIDAHSELVREFAANPLFELANHGTGHRPLSVNGRSAYGIAGTGSAADVVDEVWGNHLALTELTGRPPRYFRAGTAHYDDVAVQIVSALGESVAGFSVNVDAGATASADAVRRSVVTAGPGDVLLAHMNHPGGMSAAGILGGIDVQRARGRHFTHMENMR